MINRNKRSNRSGQSGAENTARTNQLHRFYTHKAGLTHISALVVMAFPAYRLIISGAR